MRVIHGDVLLNFGKYKGRAVADALRDDPGYFFWLVVNRKAALGPDIKAAVVEWAHANPKEAGKISQRAGGSAAATFGSLFSEEQSPVTNNPIMSPARPVERPAVWGTW